MTEQELKKLEVLQYTEIIRPLKHELEKLRAVGYTLELINDYSKEIEKACLEDNAERAGDISIKIALQATSHFHVLNDILDNLESIVEGKKI